MKKFLAVMLVVMLSGCNAWIGGNIMDAAQFVCRNYNGVQHINTFMSTTIKCRTGKVFYYSEAVDMYSKAVSGQKE